MKIHHFRIISIRRLGNLSYIFGIALMFASLLTSLVPPTVASAHAAVISGSASCSNGTQTVNWTVHNDYNLDMTINSSNPNVVGGTVGPLGTTHGQSTYPGTQSGNVTLTVHSTWSDGFSTTNSGSVHLAGNCFPPPTNTPKPPTNTPEQPTNTSVPPTNTPTNTSMPTNRSVPSDTPVPTNTPVPPTETPIPPTDTPTNTPVNSNRHTNHYAHQHTCDSHFNRHRY